MYSDNLKRNILGSCENPQVIVNPYTKRRVTVSCGTCKVCKLNKGLKYKSLCSIEESCYKYAYFVTLTYRQDKLPRMRVEQTEDPNGVCVLKDSSFDGVFNGEVLGHYRFKPGELEQIQETVKLDGDLPYLRYSDLQLFIKRFRKYVSVYTNSKVRFFAVGEYGPSTYRAHWHIIFYFDDPQISKAMRAFVLKSWKFGFVSVSASRGSVDSYLSGYVNTDTVLPDVFKLNPIRPKSFHSFHFGMGLFEPRKKEIYEKGFEFFERELFEIGGKPVALFPFNRLRCYFFPKCVGYDAKDFDKLYQRYTVYDRAQRAFPGYSYRDLIRVVADFIDGFYDRSKFTPEQLSVIEFVMKMCPKQVRLYEPHVNRYSYAEQFVRGVFGLSRHFLDFCCDGKRYRAAEMIQKIVKFYGDMNYSLLSKWYSAQEEYLRLYSGTSFESGYALFYDEWYRLYPGTSKITYEELCNSNPVHVMIKAQKYAFYESRQKTRKMNDSSGSFTVKLPKDVFECDPNFNLCQVFKQGTLFIDESDIPPKAHF